MQKHTVWAALLLVLLLGPAMASAGPLAKTARGVDNKTSSDSGSSSSSSSDNDSGSDDQDTSSSSGSSSSSGTHSHSSVLDGEDSCYSCEDNGPTISLEDLGPASFEARFAAQKVRDSDGSFRFDALLRFGRLGVYAAGDYYYEHIEAKGTMGQMSEDVRVNLFETAVLGRFIDEDVVTADLRLGFAAAASNLFDTLPGAVFGMRLAARANETIALSVEARAMAFQHDVTAFEGAAGAQIKMIWLGYRALKFDVGPVLEGPEAGVRFHF